MASTFYTVPLLTAYEKLLQLADICRVPDTIVIKAYNRSTPTETMDIIWQDHGNGLRSLHFSKQFRLNSEDYSWVMMNYRFQRLQRAGFAASYGNAAIYGSLSFQVDGYDILRIKVESNEGSTSNEFTIDVVVPSKDLARPVPITGAPRVPK